MIRTLTLMKIIMMMNMIMMIDQIRNVTMEESYEGNKGKIRRNNTQNKLFSLVYFWC